MIWQDRIILSLIGMGVWIVGGVIMYDRSGDTAWSVGYIVGMIIGAFLGWTIMNGGF